VVVSTLISRSTRQPGWKWSERVKPIAGTESCRVQHNGYGISGQWIGPDFSPAMSDFAEPR
jgi:hypothetical protein